MKFFNRQEEVIDLQLTQYGKILFAGGQLKPASYVFLDDDIVYDKQYATHAAPGETHEDSISGADREEQNEAEDRIKEIPRIHTQYNWGRKFTETELTEVQRFTFKVQGPQKYWYDENSGEWSTITPLHESDFDTFYHNIPLGNCTPGVNYAPSWNIMAHHEEFEVPSLTLNLTGTHTTTTIEESTGIINVDDSLVYFGDLAIPQLSSSIELLSSFYPADDVDVFQQDVVASYNIGSNRVLTLKGGYLLLEINEENTAFERENFSIEVFEITEPYVNGNTDLMTPKMFFEDPSIPKASPEIYVPPTETGTPIIQYDKTYAEYYFDIRVDEEIDSSLLCKLVDKKKSVFSDNEVKCNENSEQGPVNIYGPDEPDPGEVC